MSRTGAFVVTGAGSGIGRAITTRLRAEGHTVFGLGRDPRKLESLGIEFRSTDLSKADDTRAAAHQIREWLGSKPLLGLVNNAGVFDRAALNDTSDAIWEKQFQTNLMSAARLSRELYPLLKTAAPSAVVNVSSTLGLKPVAHTGAYSAMKAAMVSLSQTLAIEWASSGIRVNCVCPGIVDTPIHSFHGLPDSDPSRAQAHALQPLGRLGTAENVAEAILFLLGERSSWTTGAVLTVDGGISL